MREEPDRVISIRKSTVTIDYSYRLVSRRIECESMREEHDGIISIRKSTVTRINRER